MEVSSGFGGILRTLRGRNFRIYWLANALSTLGTWVHRLALAWLAWELTKSPAWLGVIAFASLFPAGFLSPFTGAVADRYGLRRVAIIALLLTGIETLVLAVIVATGLITIEILLAFTIFHAVMIAFEIPSRMALVPDLVAREVLSSAVAINMTTFHAGAFMGPLFFAFVVAAVGVSAAFFLNAATLFLFVGALTMLRLEQRPKGAKRATSIIGDMIDGLKYARDHRGIFALLLFSAIPHIFVRPYIDLLPSFADDVFGRGADGFATLAGASGLGALSGGIWLASRGGLKGLTRILVGAVLTASLALLLFSVASNFSFAIACLFVVGFATVISSVSNQTLMQSAADPALRGRIIAISTSLAVALPAVSALVLGALGSLVGIQWPVAGGAVIAMILWLYLSQGVRRARPILEEAFG